MVALAVVGIFFNSFFSEAQGLMGKPKIIYAETCKVEKEGLLALKTNTFTQEAGI